MTLLAHRDTGLADAFSHGGSSLVLPRWLGIFTAVTAVALAVNAGFVFASFVPALLLFLLWTLVTSIVLLRRTPSTQPRIAFEGTGPRRATSSTT